MTATEIRNLAIIGLIIITPFVLAIFLGLFDIMISNIAFAILFAVILVLISLVFDSKPEPIRLIRNSAIIGVIAGVLWSLLFIFEELEFFDALDSEFSSSDISEQGIANGMILIIFFSVIAITAHKQTKRNSGNLIQTEITKDTSQGQNFSHAIAEWHIAINNQPSEKLSIEEVKTMIQKGVIIPKTLFWRAGMGNWQEAQFINEINKLF